MKHILIVDDDIYIGNMVEELLRREGYLVSRAYSGTEALLVYEKRHPDLILLDLMLPGLTGEEVMQHLVGTPVIVVSAKIDVNDKVDLLLSGATDYITKPFDTKELLARITVQLRKAATATSHIIQHQDITLDTDTHMVCINETPVRLTKTEYAILKLLLQNPTQVLTKSFLLERISEESPDCVESSLKVHVSNLRKKLKEITNKDYIEAVWGIGFKLADS